MASVVNDGATASYAVASFYFLLYYFSGMHFVLGGVYWYWLQPKQPKYILLHIFLASIRCVLNTALPAFAAEASLAR